MSEKDTGGPAFPQSEIVTDARDWTGTVIPPHVISSGGMTLRDWFAGQALAGILAEGGASTFEADARNAYKAADEMLIQQRLSK